MGEHVFEDLLNGSAFLFGNFMDFANQIRTQGKWLSSHTAKERFQSYAY